MEASKNTEARGATAELPHVQYMRAFIVQCECSMTQVFQGSRKESAFLSLGLDGAKAVWVHIFYWVLLPDRYGIVFRTIDGTAEVSTSFRSLHFVI
jgi:hypothetical protein